MIAKNTIIIISLTMFLLVPVSFKQIWTNQTVVIDNAWARNPHKRNPHEEIRRIDEKLKQIHHNILRLQEEQRRLMERKRQIQRPPRR